MVDTERLLALLGNLASIVEALIAVIGFVFVVLRKDDISKVLRAGRDIFLAPRYEIKADRVSIYEDGTELPKTHTIGTPPPEQSSEQS